MNQAKTVIPETLFRKGIRYRYMHSDTEQVTCVLLHGLGNSLDFWDDVFYGLSQNASVVSLDLPGAGRSLWPKKGRNISDIADAVSIFLKDLNIRRATVIAHSFGVATALTLAQRSPRLVERIIIVNGTLQTADSIVKRPYGSLRHPRVAITLAAQLVAAMFHADGLVYSLAKSTPVTRYLALTPFVANPATIDSHRWKRVFSDNTGASIVQTLQETRTLDFIELMRTVTAPTALIWGACDPLITSQDVKATTSMMNVYAMHELPRCGHWPMLEVPEAFLGAVRASLAQDT